MNYRPKRKKQSTASVAASTVTDYQINAITHDARGIAKGGDGKVTFIAGAIPGEQVKARVFKSNRRYDEANLVEIIQASEHRVQPACSHFDNCGGCSFQHLDYPSQLEFKSQWLQGQLRKLAFDGEIELLVDQPFAYRRRARLSVKVNKQGQVDFGFRSKNSSDIVNIARCDVLTKSLQALLPDLRETLITSIRPQVIGHIELLEDNNGRSVLLRLTDLLPQEDMTRWQSLAEHNNLVLYLQEAKDNSVACSEEELREYQVEGLRVRYHPQAFIQVNDEMNQKMVAQALTWLDLTKKDKVLDLFCGVGNFTLSMANRVDSVVGVELQEQMVENARQNAILNQLNNVTFVGADLTKPVKSEHLQKGFNKILLDPPRAGAIEFLPSLIKLKAKTILYVSCDAATLARDAEVLTGAGYKVMRVGMMEMFPQTSHVETMMLLQK